MAGIRTEITLTTDEAERAVLQAWNPSGLGTAVGKVAREQLKVVSDWLTRTQKTALFSPADVQNGRDHLAVVSYWADVLGQHDEAAAAEFRASSEQVAALITAMEQLLARSAPTAA